MRYKLPVDVLTVLAFLLKLPAVSLSRCGEERTNVDEGSIKPPTSFLESATCTWVVSSPPGKKLLISLKQLSLQERTSELYISLDRGEPQKFEKNCDLCLNVTAEVLNVTYHFTNSENDNETLDPDEDDKNLPVEANETSSEASVFIISYESFDPDSCLPAVSPENGYVVGKSRNIGSKIQYRCNEPFELLGPLGAKCVVNSDSLIPRWDFPEPWCEIPACNGVTQNKTAGREIGVIVHPGYPAQLTLGEQSCTWMIKASEKNRRVSLTVKEFNLPVSKKKLGPAGSSFLEVYDSSMSNLIVRLRNQETPRTFVTESDLMILVLRVSSVPKANDAGGAFGFYLEYSATCEAVNAIEHGSVNFSGKSAPFGVGSSVSFRCDKGFELVGNMTMTCAQGASWVGEKPECREVDDVVVGGEDSVGSEEVDVTTESVESGFGSVKTVNNKKDSPVLHQNAGSKTFDEKPDKGIEVSKTFAQNLKPVADINPTSSEDASLLESDFPSATARSDVDQMSTLFIIVGVAVPIVLLTFLIFGGYVWYRRQYPVRMGIGRKFETFENPAYDRKKGKLRGNPDFPDEPAELQKLTSLPSP